ncbi:MAG: hypothetical protein A2Y25_04915 [Candidatus Melainabacteria bacterium GWF2_37_15]|nr:MAG: hypothetical protein A2Y25_04915 [Candidatus Melainabacteria bacterium GWF2_37_15]
MLILFFLAGCVKKPEKTVIKFMSWGSKSEVSIIQPLIKEFESQNPDIKVEFIHTPNNYFQKLHLLAASGLTPDVVFVNNIYGPLYAENGIFMDLSGYFTGAKYFHKEALHALNHKGKLYAVPRDVSNLVIYYNKDIFDKHNVSYPSSDWTFEDFLNICKKLTNKNNWGISFEEAPLFWLPYLWSNGGGFISPDLKQIDLDKPEAIQAIQFYSDLRNKYHVAPTKSQTGSATMAQLFMQEKLAMHFSGRWFMPIYTQEIKFNWGIVRFPKGKAGSVVGCDSSGWAISSKTMHPEEALRFVRFLSSKTSIEKFTKSGLITPARMDVEDPVEVFTETIKYSIPTPVTQNYQRLTDILINALEPVWAGKTTAEKAVDEKLIQKFYLQ